MPTPHNEALKGDIAKVVLMPGDPNRAKWIVDNFLHDVKLVNQVRGMVCYTGLTKNNKRISVMSSGMGHPSIGIYSHELYTEYDVDVIIRVGTCGSYQPNINLKDVLVCQGACTDSDWMRQYGLNGTFSAIASYDVLEEAVSVLKKHNYPYHVGNIFAADVFYDVDKDLWKRWARLGVMGVEMESYALYTTAANLHKKALCILTVSDSFITHEETTPEQRQTSFKDMMKVALEVAIKD